jgi:hypothetical protein
MRELHIERVTGYLAVFLTVLIPSNARTLARLAATNNPAPSFSLTIGPTKSVVSPGVSTIDVTVKNTSDVEISYQINYISPEIENTDQVTITDSKSSVVQETSLGKRLRGHDPTSVSAIHGNLVNIDLKPGDSFTYQVRLDSMYDLNRSQKYVIQIQRFDEVSRQIVHSNKTAITVKP